MGSTCVLVTGANGFVGRVVCAELARRGHRVRSAVRVAAAASESAGEVVCVGSLSADTDWSDALVGVDAVVHLAARVHVMKETAADALAEYRRVNVQATDTLARAAAASRVKRLVYVSSIKVNGDVTAGTPFRAFDPPQPSDAYGVSKHEAEEALWRVAAATGLEVAVVRPPLVYGPGVRGNFLRLLKLVSRGFPLPFGAVHNKRSMIYSANLASALATCATHPRSGGQTYLVSDGEDLSTPDLIRRVAQALGTRPHLWQVPPALLRLGGAVTGKADEVTRLVGSLTVDSAPIRESLGWSPPYDVAEGLSETAGWFKMRL
jgi:nucleoside-diphosphate-sugar epimerase